MLFMNVHKMAKFSCQGNESDMSIDFKSALLSIEHHQIPIKVWHSFLVIIDEFRCQYIDSCTKSNTEHIESKEKLPPTWLNHDYD